MTWRPAPLDVRPGPGGQYSRFRLVVGVYLSVHFAHLAPWAAEVFSSAGACCPRRRLSPLRPLFPNVLAIADGPSFVTAFVAAAAWLASCSPWAAADRLCAICMFYVLACLYGRNPLIANPSPALRRLAAAGPRYLAAGCRMARGRSWRPDPGGGWQILAATASAAWFLLAAGYSFSGYTKLVSPSWLDGTALAHVLDNPLARPGFAARRAAGACRRPPAPR